MYAFSTEAFRKDLDPLALFSIARSVGDKDAELSEELEAFAADFAAIRNLPVVTRIFGPNEMPPGLN